MTENPANQPVDGSISPMHGVDERTVSTNLQRLDEPVAGPPLTRLRSSGIAEECRESANTKVTRRAVYRAEVHSGPIPDPESLAKYGDLDPGLPSRIVGMAESQLAHRQTEERERRMQVTQENSRLLNQGDRGQHYALIVVLSVLALAALALVMNNPKTAVAIVSIDIVSVAALFLFSGNNFAGRREPMRSRAPKGKIKTNEEDAQVQNGN
jgi:uncharacterized membrane protein